MKSTVVKYLIAASRATQRIRTSANIYRYSSMLFYVSSLTASHAEM